jgi:hypothetical protein
VSRGRLLVDAATAIVIVVAGLLLLNGMATVMLLALLVLFGLGVTGLVGRLRRRRRGPSGRRPRQGRRVI